MRRRTRIRWGDDAPRVAMITMAVALALALAGCGSFGVAAPTPTLYDEAGMPRWASVIVTGEPAVAERDLDLVLLMLPEATRLRTLDVPAGTVIRWDEGVSEGPYRVVGPDAACQLDVDLPPEQATHVVLSVTADGCTLRVAGPGDDPSAAASGSVMAMVTLQPWDGLLVEAVSLDDPRQPVPDAVPPDEGGLAIIDPLYEGAYDIRLRRGDEVLESHTIAIEDRGPAGHLIQLDFDGVPD